MKITIRPISNPEREIDLTQRLIALIAEELWKHTGGDATLNWLEAEMHLQRIVAPGLRRSRNSNSRRPSRHAPAKAA